MKVILLQDVKALGKKGEMVDVSDGYARNFILPKNVGIEANSTNINNLKLQKAHEEKLAQERLEDAKKFADQIAERPVELTIKYGKDGRAFGSVSSKEISIAAKEQLGFDIDKKKITLPIPIKAAGTFVVNVKLHKDVTAELTVKVHEV